MRLYREEGGQAIVLVLIGIAILTGFMALAIDVGLLFRARRNIQIAADSAATAGAQAYLDYGYDPNQGQTLAAWVTSAAQGAATLNGVTDGQNGAHVYVNQAPNISTPYHNSTGYVEAIVSEPNPTMFMNWFSQMFGSGNFGTVTVAARAVAGSPGVSQGCVFVLNPSACPAMNLQGSFTVTANKCGVVVDSTCQTGALNFTGGGGTLTADWVGVAGTVTGQSGDSDPAPVTGIVPVTNPLQAVSPPAFTPANCIAASGTLTGNIGSSSATTCYSGNGGNITLSNVTLTGTIVFYQSSVTLNGTINSGASGTTLDLNDGGLTENTGTTMNIVAPTTGTYRGIAIVAPASNTSTLEFDKGAAGGTFSGVIDAPGAELYLHDSGGDHSGGLTINADLVVGTLDDDTATFTINSYSAQNPSSTPLASVSLVE